MSAALPTELNGANIPPVPGFTKREPDVRFLLDLRKALKDDPNTLLGNRFLCRGGGLLVVGASGIGKSTWIMQAGICWAVGRTFCEISPRKPLKILYVQAENDEGDLCEMRDGVIENLRLKDKELARLKRNFICVFESTRVGTDFITETLAPLLEQYAPDLLILDPALSYLGGSSNEQEVVGGFLRNHLNPLLQQHKCGVAIVHHTNKPKKDPKSPEQNSNDFAYAGTGSAEWGNWARAVLVLEAKNKEGVRTLRIGKRFRLPWLVAVGEPTSVKYLIQSPRGKGLCFHEMSDDEMAGLSSKKSALNKVLDSCILPDPGKDISQELLLAQLTNADDKICGRDKANKEVIPLLIHQGFLTRKEVPRTTGRAEIVYTRTDKVPGHVSFVVKAPTVSSDGVIPSHDGSQSHQSG